MERLNIEILKALKAEYDKDPHGYVKTQFLQERIGISDEKLITSIKYLENENFIEPLWSVGKELPGQIKIKPNGVKFLEGENLSNKLGKISTHPLAVALIALVVSIPLTAYATYQITISSINYEYESQNQLKVTIIGSKEVVAEPDKNYNYNNIGLYNPTLKQISLDTIKYSASEDWFQKAEQMNITENSRQIIPSLPTFPDINEPSYAPYMVLEPGKFQVMNGIFKLHTPKKEGDYYLKFCAYTLDDKSFCSDNLLIHVRVNQTNLS